MSNIHDADPYDWDPVYAAAAIEQLREQLAAMTGRAEKAEAGVDRWLCYANELENKLGDERQRAERAGEMRDVLAVTVELLDRLASEEECELWPSGCQAHGGYPAPCPHPLARQLVAAWREVEQEANGG